MGRGLRSNASKRAMVSSSIVAVIGGINMDLVFETDRPPDRGESLDASSIQNLHGGKGANTAIALYRASHTSPVGDREAEINPEEETSAVNGHRIQVFMNGAVGNDQFGTELKRKLEMQNINISGVQTVKGISGTCTVIVDTLTRDSRNIAYQAANLEWRADDPEAVECLAGGSKPDLVIAHLGIPRERIEQALRTATKAGVDTLLNPSPAHTLLTSTYNNLTHLILNEQEAAHLSGRKYEELVTPTAWKTAAEEFVEWGVQNVVITLAEKGAYFATHDGKNGKIDAVQGVVVQDTTGAGDTFVGMYAVEYLQQKSKGEWDIEKAIQHACKASARTIEQLGAQESIPCVDEVDA